jgi:chromate transporter
VGGSLGQIAAILVGVLAGILLCRDLFVPIEGRIGFAISPRMGAAALTVFFGLLLALPLLAGRSHGLAVFEAFYRAGALVFGGGHVVLPLLHDAVVAPGWISSEAFLAGYGAAQAVPGPLFTVAAYLGAGLTGTPHGVWGAALALVAIFLPGLLILSGTLPFWDRFRLRADAQAVMRGVHAAVVGLLAAALYDPLWKSAILSWSDLALALAGFALLTFLKWPPLTVVAGTVAAAMMFATLG